MKFPALFRRRSLLLPTLTGWALILLVCGSVTLFLFRNAAVFLIVNEPVGAEYLLIEGWIEKGELDQALEYFYAGGYSKAIIVGGPITDDFHDIDTNTAERAGNYLRGNGLVAADSVVIAAPFSAQNRTYLNAVLARNWFAEQGIALSKLDVFSSDVHTRRSQYLYQLAFGDTVAVGVIPSEPADFDPARWWQESGTGKYVAVEFAGWLLVRCCFSPGEPGSHDEMWGKEKPPAVQN